MPQSQHRSDYTSHVTTRYGLLYTARCRVSLLFLAHITRPSPAGLLAAARPLYLLRPRWVERAATVPRPLLTELALERHLKVRLPRRTGVLTHP